MKFLIYFTFEFSDVFESSGQIADSDYIIIIKRQIYIIIYTQLHYKIKKLNFIFQYMNYFTLQQ